jgi:hypothetical protein
MRDPGRFTKEKVALFVCCLSPSVLPPSWWNETNSLGNILTHIFQVLTPGLDTELRSEFSCPFPAKLILGQASNHRILFRAINMKILNFPGVLRNINHVFKGP